jgi:hypothetical protein
MQHGMVAMSTDPGAGIGVHILVLPLAKLFKRSVRQCSHQWNGVLADSVSGCCGGNSHRVFREVPVTIRTAQALVYKLLVITSCYSFLNCILTLCLMLHNKSPQLYFITEALGPLHLPASLASLFSRS